AKGLALKGFIAVPKEEKAAADKTTGEAGTTAALKTRTMSKTTGEAGTTAAMHTSTMHKTTGQASITAAMKTSTVPKTTGEAGTTAETAAKQLQLPDQLKLLLKSFHEKSVHRKSVHRKTNKKTFISTPLPLTRSAKSFTAPVKFHVYSESSFTGRFKE